jgi:PAS domain S-box-containing protein
MNQPGKTKEVMALDLETLYQQNEVLRERCAFLERIINLTPHDIFVKDREGRFILVNQAFAKAYGNTTIEAMLGKSEADFNPDPGLAEKYHRDDLVVIETGQEQFISEERVVKGDGEVVWREIVRRPILGPDGAAQHVLGIMTNITERKQAEEALAAIARENSQLAATINNLTGGVTITDPNLPDNPLIFVNPAFEQMTGYSRAEVIGRNCRFLQGPKTDPKSLNEIRQAIAQRRSCTVTLMNYRKDGLPFWNELTISPVFDDQGQLINFIGLQIDVTARKQAEEALRESEERLRQVFSSISDHIYVTEVTKEGQRINRYLSPVEALTGYPLERLLADWSFWPSKIIHPDDRERAAAQAERLAQGQNSEMEYRLVRADGRVIWVRDSGRVEREPLSQSLFVYGVVSDVTDRRQAEEALAHARDRALEASHLKSQLLAKVSHELRTPLGAILGYTELLRDGVFGPLPEQPVRVLTEVINSTEYLTELVNELLDQAQFESGRIQLKNGPFVIKEMVQRVEARMSVLAQAKGLALATDIASDLPDILIGDENRLQQILVNLVSNAIKFTKAGAVQVHLFCSDPEHWAIKVTDTGPGIPKEAHSYIFEPFRQVDGSMTREHIGAGLGLAIVKQLTTLMGGEIILKSEVGQGSTFTVLLPLGGITNP